MSLLVLRAYGLLLSFERNMSRRDFQGIYRRVERRRLQLWIITAFLFVIVRFGLLTIVVALAVGNFAGAVPLTPNLSHWSATTSNITVAIVVGIACFGYYAARAGEPLFGKLE